MEEVINKNEKERLHLRGEDGKVYFGWKMVVFLFVLNFFAYSCAISCMGLFQIAVIQDMGFTVGQWTYAGTLGGPIGGVLLSLGTKLMTEKYLKKTMIIGGLLTAVAFICQSFATQYWMFFLTTTVFGITSTFITITPTQIIVSNWFGSRARGFAISLILGGLAAVTASPILGFIINTVSWRAGYRFIGFGILLCVFGMFYFIVYGPGNKGLKRMGDDELEKKVRNVTKMGLSVSDGHKKPIVWLVYIASALTYVCSANLLAHLATYLIFNGFSPTITTSIMTLMFALLMVGCVIEGSICDRGWLKVIAPLAEFGMAGAYISLLLIPVFGPWMLGVYVVCYAIGVPSVNVVTPLVLTHVVGEKHTPEFMSYCMAIIFITIPFCMAGVGRMFDITDSYKLPFVFLICLAIIAGIIRAVASSTSRRYVPSEKEIAAIAVEEEEGALSEDQ